MLKVEKLRQRKPYGVYFKKAMRTAIPALLFLSIGIWWGLRSRPQPVEINTILEDPVVVSQAAPIVTPTPVVVLPVQKPVTRPARSADVASRGEVQFNLPADVEAYLDGQWVDQSKPFKAKVGKHRLELRKPGYSPIEQTIEVDSKEPTVIRVGQSGPVGAQEKEGGSP